MQKMQILFPDPLMAKIRTLSQKEDRPVSEIIRRAVESWLERSSTIRQDLNAKDKKVPVFDGGEVLTDSKHIRDIIYRR